MTGSVTSPNVRTCAEVFCDNSGRLGSLSYLVPSSLSVKVGDAVHVPFGKKEVVGVVIGKGDPKKATREIISVYGKRVSASDIEFAHQVADHYFSTFTSVATRLAPKSGKGDTPLQCAAPALLDFEKASILPNIPLNYKRRYLLRAPLAPSARVAAEEAMRMLDSKKGQVLIICPTTDAVSATLAEFSDGAARLDSKARRGAWRAFCEGVLPIGIGTRASALYSAESLVGIIVVDEDHPGHNEAQQPYTNSRDLAALRATYQNVPLTMIGTNPTPSALGSYVKVFPVAPGSWPAMRVIDRNDFAFDQRRLPPPLMAALTRAEKNGQSPIMLAEKKKATRRCTKCGIERPCAQCVDSTCSHTENTPCSRCQETKVRMMGWDKDRLHDLFKGRAKPILLPELQTVKNCGLVVLYDIDPVLSMPGFYPDSLAAHILLAAAEAAGPGGSVLVLTSKPQTTILADLCARKDQITMAKRTYATARKESLPPFGRVVTIHCGQDKQPNVSSWPGTVYGPRKNGKEWEIIVKLKNEELPRMKNRIDYLRRGGKVRVHVV